MSEKLLFTSDRTTGQLPGHPWLPPALALAGVAGAIVADQLPTHISNRKLSTEARHQTIGQGRPNHLMLFGGMRMQADELIECIGRPLTDDYCVSAIHYQDLGFELDEVKNATLEASAEAGDTNLVIDATSLGGIVVAASLQDEKFARQLGPVDTIIFDSCPSSIDDVRWIGKLGILAATWTGNSAVAMRAAEYVLSRREVQESQLILQTIQDNHPSRDRKWPSRTISRQGKFIDRNPMLPGSLEGKARQIFYLHGPEDNVVNPITSLQGIRTAAGSTPVEDIVDYDRPAVSHAVGARHPGMVIDLLRRTARELSARSDLSTST